MLDLIWIICTFIVYAFELFGLAMVIGGMYCIAMLILGVRKITR